MVKSHTVGLPGGNPEGRQAAGSPADGLVAEAAEVSAGCDEQLDGSDGVSLGQREGIRCHSAAQSNRVLVDVVDRVR